MSNFRVDIVRNSQRQMCFRQRPTGAAIFFPPYRNPGIWSLNRILCAKNVSTSCKLPVEILQAAAREIDPKKYTEPGARKVAIYLRGCLREGDLDGLKYPVVCKVMGKENVRSFVYRSGTKNYHTALAFRWAPNISREILKGLYRSIHFRPILEECKKLRELSAKKPLYPSKAKFKAAAEKIKPSLFNSNPAAQRAAKFFRQTLKRDRPHLLSRGVLIRYFGSSREIDNFATMVNQGSTSHLLALAALIRDRDVMGAVLNACEYTQNREQILSRCQGPKIVSLKKRPKAPKKPPKRGGYSDKEREYFKSWAEKEFGEVAKQAKEKDATDELLRKLTWGYANAHYREYNEYRRGTSHNFAHFCNVFGGSSNDEGWYNALKKVYGISDRKIGQIKRLGNKFSRMRPSDDILPGLIPSGK